MIGHALLMSTFLRKSRYKGSPRPILIIPPSTPRTMCVGGMCGIAVISEVVSTKIKGRQRSSPRPQGPQRKWSEARNQPLLHNTGYGKRPAWRPVLPVHLSACQLLFFTSVLLEQY